MTQPQMIALEIHDISLWDASRVLPIIDTMENWGYNALVLHQNDLLDIATQLGLTANYGVSDLRLKKVRNATAWLNRLVDRLVRFDAKLFLEIKEPSFHDYALEIYPDLLGEHGLPDPTSPSWCAFCEAKTKDLLARVPGLGGLIVNLSSPESRVSVPDYLAVSASEPMDMKDWFRQMIAAFHKPLAAADMALYVRDFSYTADMQSDVLNAVDAYDGKVGASVKITAHDYFPEYPENPAAHMTNAPMIMEFEAFGEHMGWGVIPNCRVAEFRERMAGYRDLGAVGILMRTSWEAIPGANALDTLSALNVFALPKLIHEDAPPRELIGAWLQETFGLDGPLAKVATDLLLDSWQIPAAAYWDTQVFPRHSCLPSTWQEGWLSMASNGMGRRDRDLAINKNDPKLSETARVRLFAEKETMSRQASDLAERASLLSEGLTPDLAELFAAFVWVPYFARQFELAIKATFFAARATSSDLQELPALRTELLTLAGALEDAFRKKPDVAHHAKVLLDPEQIKLFVQSLT